MSFPRLTTVGCVMLTSTPALAAQAIRSVKRTCPAGVAIAWGLGLYNVSEEAPAELPDVDLAAHFGGEQPFSFSQFNNQLARKLMEQYSGRGRMIDCQLDYLLFLNDDVHARDGSRWLERMIGAHKEANASQVGIKLVYPPGTKMEGRIQHAGVHRGASSTGTHRGLYADPDAPPFTEPGFIETWAVTGACILVTPEHFMRVGGFDTSYHALWQDIDLSLSLRAAIGRPVICVQDEWLYHFEGATQGGRFESESWQVATTPDLGVDRDHFLERWPPWRDATNEDRAGDDESQ